VSGEAESCLQIVLMGMLMEKLYLNICWLTISKMAAQTKACRSNKKPVCRCVIRIICWYFQDRIVPC